MKHSKAGACEKAGAIIKCKVLLCSDKTNLVDKGMVHEVRATDAEVEHVNLL